MSNFNYGLVTSIEELTRFAAMLTANNDPFGFDIETGYLGPDAEKFSLHPETAILAGISFTNSEHWARYAPLGHEFGVNLDNYQAAEILWPVLSTGQGVAHNAPFELRHLARWFRQHLSDHPVYGQQVRSREGYFKIRSDTQVEAYLVAEHEKFGLKPLVKNLFGHTMTELHELFPDLPKNRHKMLRFNVLDPTDPKVYEYACEDSLWCLKIHHLYHRRVKDTFLYKVEHGIVQDCVHEMEDFGVAYDWGYMRRGAEALLAFRDSFNAEIMAGLSEMVGQPVSIKLSSPKQVADMLYGKLGMRTNVYTPGTRNLPPDQRKMSTGKIALAGLAKKYPVVKQILEWKEQTRLHGTYLSKYEKLYSYADDGRTHPNHLSAVVITGRFAVAEPPYQQSPKDYHFDLAPAKAAHAAHEQAHGEDCDCHEMDPPPGTCFTFNFRDAIIAPPEHYILGFDLSQAELRAIAGEARETSLLRAFERGDDVHTLTAALMLGKSPEQITKKERAIGKTMNFALLYGMSVQGLADRLSISKEEAQILYDKYFAAFPAISVWMERQVQFGRTNGYVTSHFGRRLPIWEYGSDKHWIRAKGDRACVNYPIQGAATGDYVKIAMLRVRKALRNAGLADKVHLVMNVHDALEFYVHKSVNPQLVINVLQPAVIFGVDGWPAMKADWHIAKRWGSPHEVALSPDGKISIAGLKQIEFGPSASSFEEDEETGELVPVLPDVDAEVVRRAAAIVEQAAATAPQPPPAPTRDGRHVLVVLRHMPDADSFTRFLEMLDSLPGPDHLTLVTPEGDLPMDLAQGTSLAPAHSSAVAMILGDCEVRIDAADIDPAELTQGLTF